MVLKQVSASPGGAYLPVDQAVPSGANVDTSSSSVSSSSSAIDEDDNDLTDNKVPQQQTVPQTQTVQQQTVTQVVSKPATVNVQKIKVRTRPQTVRMQINFFLIQ